MPTFGSAFHTTRGGPVNNEAGPTATLVPVHRAGAKPSGRSSIATVVPSVFLLPPAGGRQVRYTSIANLCPAFDSVRRDRAVGRNSTSSKRAACVRSRLSAVRTTKTIPCGPHSIASKTPASRLSPVPRRRNSGFIVLDTFVPGSVIAVGWPPCGAAGASSRACSSADLISNVRARSFSDGSAARATTGPKTLRAPQVVQCKQRFAKPQCCAVVGAFRANKGQKQITRGCVLTQFHVHESKQELGFHVTRPEGNRALQCLRCLQQWLPFPLERELRCIKE